jgi:hypothetical protein
MTYRVGLRSGSWGRDKCRGCKRAVGLMYYILMTSNTLAPSKCILMLFIEGCRTGKLVIEVGYQR